MSDEENPGYILRVAKDHWLEQIFTINKYYSGVSRNWRRGTPILLAMKAGSRDCFVGYGVVDKVEMLWEMTPDEEEYCRDNGWKCALTFRGLTRLQEPVPIRETVLSGDRRTGSFLHGAKLTEDQVDSIIEAAEEHAELASNATKAK